MSCGRTGRVFPPVLCFFLFLSSSLVLLAQQRQLRNPHRSPADVKAGKRIFRIQCTICHGLDAKGFFAPDLTREKFRHAGTDSDLFRIISFGIPGTVMYPLRTSERQIWQIIAFVRTLKGTSNQLKPIGNPESGLRIFREKGECQKCHMVNGEGGRLGPDLSDVGWQRSLDYLRDSILKPSEVIGSVLSGRYAPVEIATRDGKVIEGVLLNEDGYSVQIMDEEENLFSYGKGDLASIERGEVSAMPSYEETFSAQELDDLVTYLYSLRRE